MRFRYETRPARVVFGRGAVRTALVGEIEHLGVQRVLVVTDRAHEAIAREVTAGFADAVVGRFAAAEPHVPLAVAMRAVTLARDLRADGVLTLGDGAATGTGKIVARETRLPILAVPTGYPATELTPVWATTSAGRRETGTDPAVLPRSVVLDPDLTDAQPWTAAVGAGLTALAQAVEAHWAPGANPVSSVLADEAVSALAAGLRGRAAAPHGREPEDEVADPVGTWAGTSQEAGEQLLYGTFVAATVRSVTGTGLHHRICHLLAGTFDLPPEQLPAVVLPHVLAFNAPAVPAAAARVARALGADHPVLGLRGLCAEVGAPRGLVELGMRRDQLEEAIIRLCAALPLPNPRPVGTADVRELLTTAYGG